jgi:hypothetical protein
MQIVLTITSSDLKQRVTHVQPLVLTAKAYTTPSSVIHEGYTTE